ncbi:MAG: 4-(cytidine 5'-diphospho)-2-C-methyl-D-erythritol kinase [Gammaproteobacteria bacterium]|nr:4-(cytidine 5'-diphospho)-2-C-methyl-D-erythritol kinase [Gammaproteobacteria bacterium]
MTIDLSWPAPAKLNLMLRITGQRADGYHLLQTVFQFIDLCDRLHFKLRDDGLVLRGNDLPGVPASEDLVVRAAKALQHRFDVKLGIAIEIEKSLPMGGGLGGGSSDAATTLVALNRIWGVNATLDELAEIGLTLGADVPVFIRGEAAWAEGVGEKLLPVTLPEPWYLLVNPACHVSTADVFADPDLTRDSQPITIRDFLAGRGGNDCLSVVARRYRLVAETMALMAPFSSPQLTGTGACLFASFDSEQQALKARAQLPETLSAYVVRGLNRSPLLDRLAEPD